MSNSSPILEGDTAIKKMCHWNSDVKVIGEVNVQIYKFGPASIRCTSYSFNVNKTNTAVVEVELNRQP